MYARVCMFVSVSKVCTRGAGMYRGQRLHMSLDRHKCWELNSHPLKEQVSHLSRPPNSGGLFCCYCYSFVWDRVSLLSNSGYLGIFYVDSIGLELTEIHLSSSMSHHAMLILSYRPGYMRDNVSKTNSHPTKKVSNLNVRYTCAVVGHAKGVSNHLKKKKERKKPRNKNKTWI